MLNIINCGYETDLFLQVDYKGLLRVFLGRIKRITAVVLETAMLGCMMMMNGYNRAA